MTVDAAIKRIHALPRFSGEPSLEPLRALLARMGDPQKSLPYIHIAGTNGKGSTATMVAAVLEEAGLRVGLYTSPFINHFRERFRINGEPVAPTPFLSAASRFFTTLRRLPAEEAARLSQFDAVTAIGFLIFAEAACDVVVLECGLGGRFDGTNVIPPPLVAAICNIGYDHTEVLGDTLEDITREKCGILKPGTGALVIGAQDYPRTVQLMEAQATRLGIPVRRVAADEIRVERSKLATLIYTYRGVRRTAAMPAAYQARNAAMAEEITDALRGLGYAISDEALAAGLARARIPARLELISLRPHVLLDGAHNPDGIRALRDSMERLVPEFGRLFCLIGMLASKSPTEALSDFFSSPLLREKLAGIATVTPNTPRACPAEELADMLKSRLRDTRVCAYENSEEAVRAILSELRDNDALLCFGSLYIMGELREAILQQI